MSREAASESGANPCPKCFPDTEYATRVEITEFPDGTMRYQAIEPDDPER